MLRVQEAITHGFGSGESTGERNSAVVFKKLDFKELLSPSFLIPASFSQKNRCATLCLARWQKVRRRRSCTLPLTLSIIWDGSAIRTGPCFLPSLCFRSQISSVMFFTFIYQQGKKSSRLLFYFKKTTIGHRAVQFHTFSHEIIKGVRTT